MNKPDIYLNTGSLFPNTPIELVQNLTNEENIIIEQAKRFRNDILIPAGFSFEQVGLSIHPGILVDANTLVVQGLSKGFEKQVLDTPDIITPGHVVKELIKRPGLAKEHIGWFILNTPNAEAQKNGVEGFIDKSRNSHVLRMSVGQIIDKEGNPLQSTIELFMLIKRKLNMREIIGDVLIAVEPEKGFFESFETYMSFVDSLNRHYSFIKFGYSYDPAHIEEMRRENPDKAFNAFSALDKIIKINPKLLLGIDLNNINSDQDSTTHKNIFEGDLDIFSLIELYGKAHRRGLVTNPALTFEGNPIDRENYYNTRNVNNFVKLRRTFQES